MVGKFLDGPSLLRRADVAIADEVDVVPVVRADHGLAALVAGADDGRLDRGLSRHTAITEVKGAQGGRSSSGLEDLAAGNSERPIGVFTPQHALFRCQVGHWSLLGNRKGVPKG